MGSALGQFPYLQMPPEQRQVVGTEANTVFEPGHSWQRLLTSRLHRLQIGPGVELQIPSSTLGAEPSKLEIFSDAYSSYSCLHYFIKYFLCIFLVNTAMSASSRSRPGTSRPATSGSGVAFGGPHSSDGRRGVCRDCLAGITTARGFLAVEYVLITSPISGEAGSAKLSAFVIPSK